MPDSVARTVSSWNRFACDRAEYMRTALKVNVSDENANEIASYFAKLFGPDSVLPKYASDMPGYKDTVRTFSSNAMNMVYVEYDMPGPVRMPFSAAPDKDCNLWIPNFGNANKITRLDAKSGQMQDFPVPNTGAARVHPAVPASDGTVWLTENSARVNFSPDAQARMWYGANPSNKVRYFYLSGKNAGMRSSGR